MTIMSQKPTIVTPADWVLGPKQGQWTYNHYAALPEDGQRYEVVEGVLYMAPSPSGAHQETAAVITTYLTIHVKFNGLGRVFAAPFDVQLARGTVVQPDVLVLLNESSDKYDRSRIIGGPDLVVEVSSPSTATYDRRNKYDSYARAGVKEYWIVDPASQTVEVLILETGMYHSAGIFSGDDTLPSLVVPEFPVKVKQFFV